jgi:hypothetical protein
MATSRLQTNARTRISSGLCVVVAEPLVNTRVWLKTYPAMKAVNTATGSVVCKDKASYTKMVYTLMDLQKPLRAAGYTVCLLHRPALLRQPFNKPPLGPLGDCRRHLHPHHRLSRQIRNQRYRPQPLRNLRGLQAPHHSRRLHRKYRIQPIYRYLVLERCLPSRLLARCRTRLHRRHQHPRLQPHRLPGPSRQPRRPPEN